MKTQNQSIAVRMFERKTREQVGVINRRTVLMVALQLVIFVAVNLQANLIKWLRNVTREEKRERKERKRERERERERMCVSATLRASKSSSYLSCVCEEELQRHMLLPRRCWKGSSLTLSSITTVHFFALAVNHVDCILFVSYTVEHSEEWPFEWTKRTQWLKTYNCVFFLCMVIGCVIL